MPNSWDEPYDKWLQARADYEAASEDFFSVIRPVVRRAAKYTASRFPAEIDADDLESGFYQYLYKSRPPKFNEAYIRKVLYHLALDEIRKLRRLDTISIDQDADRKKKPAESPAPSNTAVWPWFATLPEPVRGYIALFKYIRDHINDETDSRTYSQTGWFSGVSGEGVRQKNLRETKRLKNRASLGHSVLDSVLSQSGAVSQESVNLLNTEMLATHSALSVSFRALCPEPASPKNPFSPESTETMSRITRGGSDASVAKWVIGCLSGTTVAVPEKLAACVERLLGNRPEAGDSQYFLDCVSLYLRAYSILLLPLVDDDAERHWTAIAAPMTPREPDFPKYWARAKGYHCLDTSAEIRGGEQCQ